VFVRAVVAYNTRVRSAMATGLIVNTMVLCFRSVSHFWRSAATEWWVVMSTASEEVTHPLQARQSAMDMVAFVGLLFLMVGLLLLLSLLIIPLGGSGWDEDSSEEGSIVLLRAMVLDASWFSMWYASAGRFLMTGFFTPPTEVRGGGVFTDGGNDNNPTLGSPPFDKKEDDDATPVVELVVVLVGVVPPIARTTLFDDMDNGVRFLRRRFITPPPPPPFVPIVVVPLVVVVVVVVLP